MELRHLRYFVAVAEELHVGRAAERLRIAQPPLSRQIRDLEREIGTPLFDRVARGVELTAAGSAFLPEARLTLAQADRAQRTAQRAARGETGRLRVGFVEAATQSGILPDVMSFFRVHLPSVGLSLFELDPLRQEEAFLDGRIDLGILHSTPLDAGRWLVVQTIHTEPVVVALPAAHRLAGRARLTLGQLADDLFVLFPRQLGPAMYDDIIARCRAAGFSPQVVQEATGWHTLASLVGAGMGVGFVPRSLSGGQQHGVVYRPVRDLAVDMALSAVWKRGDRSPVRERFVTALRAVAGARERHGR
jgi:DNA-binding transcriptional LysR family regulator